MSNNCFHGCKPIVLNGRTSSKAWSLGFERSAWRGEQHTWWPPRRLGLRRHAAFQSTFHSCHSMGALHSDYLWPTPGDVAGDHSIILPACIRLVQCSGMYAWWFAALMIDTTLYNVGSCDRWGCTEVYVQLGHLVLMCYIQGMIEVWHKYWLDTHIVNYSSNEIY